LMSVATVALGQVCIADDRRRAGNAYRPLLQPARINMERIRRSR